MSVQENVGLVDLEKGINDGKHVVAKSGPGDAQSSASHDGDSKDNNSPKSDSSKSDSDIDEFDLPVELSSVKKSSSGKIVFIILGIVLLIAVVGASWYLCFREGATYRTSKSPPEQVEVRGNPVGRNKKHKKEENKTKTKSVDESRSPPDPAQETVEAKAQSLEDQQSRASKGTDIIESGDDVVEHENVTYANSAIHIRGGCVHIRSFPVSWGPPGPREVNINIPREVDMIWMSNDGARKILGTIRYVLSEALGQPAELISLHAWEGGITLTFKNVDAKSRAEVAMEQMDKGNKFKVKILNKIIASVKKRARIDKLIKKCIIKQNINLFEWSIVHAQ